jgi:hypothetical protein
MLVLGLTSAPFPCVRSCAERSAQQRLLSWGPLAADEYVTGTDRVDYCWDTGGAVFEVTASGVSPGDACPGARARNQVRGISLTL